MSEIHRTPCMTGAGACCLWNASSFTHVTDEDSHFDAIIDEDGLADTIAAGGFVPVNDEGDGGYDIAIRIAEDDSTPDGTERATEVSLPYRFVTDGNICVSGIEFVGHPIDQTVQRVAIPSGEYVAVVYNIDGPADSPQFLIVLRPLVPDEPIDFCTHDDTFCRNPPVLSNGHVGFRVESCDNWRQLKADTMAVTGHDKIGVSVAYKEHIPLYLGNGHQDAARIQQLVPALVTVAQNLNCEYHFTLDEQPVETEQLLNTFPT